MEMSTPNYQAQQSTNDDGNFWHKYGWPLAYTGTTIATNADKIARAYQGKVPVYLGSTTAYRTVLDPKLGFASFVLEMSSKGLNLAGSKVQRGSDLQRIFFGLSDTFSSVVETDIFPGEQRFYSSAGIAHDKMLKALTSKDSKEEILRKCKEALKDYWKEFYRGKGALTKDAQLEKHLSSLIDERLKKIIISRERGLLSEIEKKEVLKKLEIFEKKIRAEISACTAAQVGIKQLKTSLEATEAELIKLKENLSKLKAFNPKKFTDVSKLLEEAKNLGINVDNLNGTELKSIRKELSKLIKNKVQNIQTAVETTQTAVETAQTGLKTAEGKVKDAYKAIDDELLGKTVKKTTSKKIYKPSTWFQKDKIAETVVSEETAKNIIKELQTEISKLSNLNLDSLNKRELLKIAEELGIEKVKIENLGEKGIRAKLLKKIKSEIEKKKNLIIAQRTASRTIIDVADDQIDDLAKAGATAVWKPNTWYGKLIKGLGSWASKIPGSGLLWKCLKKIGKILGKYVAFIPIILGILAAWNISIPVISKLKNNDVYAGFKVSIKEGMKEVLKALIKLGLDLAFLPVITIVIGAIFAPVTGGTSAVGAAAVAGAITSFIATMAGSVAVSMATDKAVELGANVVGLGRSTEVASLINSPQGVDSAVETNDIRTQFAKIKEQFAGDTATIGEDDDTYTPPVNPQYVQYAQQQWNNPYMQQQQWNPWGGNQMNNTYAFNDPTDLRNETLNTLSSIGV